MFNIDFYRTAQGFSDIENFLDDLEKRAATNKDARIQHKQVAQYIQFLADHGTRLGENITKHLDDDIWELRPETTVFYSSISRMILLYFCITFAKKHKRHLNMR